MVKKCIEWDEPMGYGDGPADWINVRHSVEWSDAARFQRAVVSNMRPGFQYDNDDQAAEDFCADRLGEVVFETLPVDKPET